jgi:hypothetical protein
MTDQELKDLVASLAIAQKETDKEIRALKASQEKTDQQIASVNKQIAKMSKVIEELGEHTGGLGKKFGNFTEGMAFPSLEKILRNRFKMDFIVPKVKIYKKGDEMELDLFAYSNSHINEVYIVEVKSHLRQKGITQILKNLERFFEFFPSHMGKKLYGIVAAVEAPDNYCKQLINKGIYLAKMQDHIFEIQVPQRFQPRSY